MLADLWKSGDVPALNAVFYRDGSYKEVDFKTVNNEKCAFVTKTGVLHELLKNPDVGLSSIAENARAATTDSQYIISCGEASWGSEGYIACLRQADESPEWVALFAESNPFDGIKIENGFVFCKSTLNENWKINLQHPSDITITPFID